MKQAPTGETEAPISPHKVQNPKRDEFGIDKWSDWTVLYVHEAGDEGVEWALANGHRLDGEPPNLGLRWTAAAGRTLGYPHARAQPTWLVIPRQLELVIRATVALMMQCRLLGPPPG